jgi:hypothetical protein
MGPVNEGRDASDQDGDGVSEMCLSSTPKRTCLPLLDIVYEVVDVEGRVDVFDRSSRD